jgi:hypothetical protein
LKRRLESRLGQQSVRELLGRLDSGAVPWVCHQVPDPPTRRHPEEE